MTNYAGVGFIALMCGSMVLIGLLSRERKKQSALVRQLEYMSRNRMCNHVYSDDPEISCDAQGYLYTRCVLCDYKLYESHPRTYVKSVQS